MKLYTYYRSSAAYRARIALNVKGVSYESIPKHLNRAGGEHRAADYLALNPQGLVPALEDDGVVIGQSMAIIEYLEERYPDPPLLPGNAFDRAQIRGMTLGIVADAHPLQNLRVTDYLTRELGQDDAAILRWRLHWMAEAFRVLENLVQRHSIDGLHCYGHSVTLIDVCLVPQLYSTQRFNLDLSPYPLLKTIGAYLERLPAFAAAHPSRQPDAE